MSKTLALESTSNIFEFHTFGENHICRYVDHANTDTVRKKSVKKL